jgi:hypothetical protein
MMVSPTLRMPFPGYLSIAAENGITIRGERQASIIVGADIRARDDAERWNG